MGGPRCSRALTLIDKNAYLVTLALVSPTRNSRSRAQTCIFTIENQHLFAHVAPGASWPPDVSAESLEARIPQPGETSAKHPQPGILSQESSARFLSQDSSARSLQPGVLSQDSSARSPQPGFLSRSPQQRFLSQDSSAISLQPICLGSALESLSYGNVFECFANMYLLQMFLS